MPFDATSNKSKITESICLQRNLILYRRLRSQSGINSQIAILVHV